MRPVGSILAVASLHFEPTRRLFAAIVLPVLVAGCAGVEVSPSGSQPASSPTATLAPAAATPTGTFALPAAALAVAPPAIVCPAVKNQTAAPASPDSWPSGQLLRDINPAWAQESAELAKAVGNPDTGASSEAWDAFEKSLTSGSETTIRASTDVVLGHLRAGCAAVAPYFDRPGAEAWAAETRALLDGMAGAIEAIRDAAIAGSKPAQDAGWTRYQNVMLDHFWQSLKGNSPESNRIAWSDGRTATASRIRWSNPAGKAFDGSPVSAWTAGDAVAPQWIELDLGWEATITGVRLLTFQEVSGGSDHVVSVGTARGDERELTRFAGNTRDQQWLEYTSSTPVSGVRILRVTTLATPSTIGWREIEIVFAPSSSPAPCPPTSSRLAGVEVAMAEPSTPGHEPAMALDGNEATGWDPGPTRFESNARGWIRLTLPEGTRASGIRVLLGPGSATAKYTVHWWRSDYRNLAPVTLSPVTADGGWATAPGPTPCTELEMVDIGVESESAAGLVLEVEVLGTAASARAAPPECVAGI